jgi:hypothetical protein
MLQLNLPPAAATSVAIRAAEPEYTTLAGFTEPGVAFLLDSWRTRPGHANPDDGVLVYPASQRGLLADGLTTLAEIERGDAARDDECGACARYARAAAEALERAAPLARYKIRPAWSAAQLRLAELAPLWRGSIYVPNDKGVMAATTVWVERVRVDGCSLVRVSAARGQTAQGEGPAYWAPDEPRWTAAEARVWFDLTHARGAGLATFTALVSRIDTRFST